VQLAKKGYFEERTITKVLFEVGDILSQPRQIPIKLLARVYDLLLLAGLIN